MFNLMSNFSGSHQGGDRGGVDKLRIPYHIQAMPR